MFAPDAGEAASVIAKGYFNVSENKQPSYGNVSSWLPQGTAIAQKSRYNACGQATDPRVKKYGPLDDVNSGNLGSPFSSESTKSDSCYLQDFILFFAVLKKHLRDSFRITFYYEPWHTLR